MYLERRASRHSKEATLTERLPRLSRLATFWRLSSSQASKTSPWQSWLLATRADALSAGSLRVSLLTFVLRRLRQTAC